MVVRRGITSEQAYMFAQRNKMFYMEVSAKTGHNVEQAFYKMAFEVNETALRNSAGRDTSRDRGARGSRTSSDGNTDGVMADRVKLKAPGSSNSNKYAAANEVPTGLNDTRKKKCC